MDLKTLESWAVLRESKFLFKTESDLLKFFTGICTQNHVPGNKCHLTFLCSFITNYFIIFHNNFLFAADSACHFFCYKDITSLSLFEDL